MDGKSLDIKQEEINKLKEIMPLARAAFALRCDNRQKYNVFGSGGF